MNRAIVTGENGPRAVVRDLLSAHGREHGVRLQGRFARADTVDTILRDHGLRLYRASIGVWLAWPLKDGICESSEAFEVNRKRLCDAAQRELFSGENTDGG